VDKQSERRCCGNGRDHKARGNAGTAQSLFQPTNAIHRKSTGPKAVQDAKMQLRVTGLLAFQFITLSCCGDVAAQLTITDPAAAGAVRQVSLSGSKGIVAARRDANRTQIRVSVQYVMVDDATRSAIYEEVDASAIKNILQVPETADSVGLDSTPSPIAASQQIRSPSRVTTCVLHEPDVALVLQKATQSPSSNVSSAPSVILLDGKEAEMNDVIQHPLVIDIAEEGGLLKPLVHSFDDGIRLRMLATLPNATPEPDSEGDPPPIELTCEIIASQLLDVKTDQVFGVQDQPLTVQVPIHQVTTALASQLLAPGQTLLIDPHVTKTLSVRSESAVPLIERIPYVGRSFKNVAVAEVEQHMIMLFQPSIEKAAP
jgi:hypothetical protein